MKKLLALLLAVLMVIPATLVPVSAAEVTAEGLKTNNCCEILATDFTNKDAFNDFAANANTAVGMLDGYQAVYFTTNGATGAEQYGGDGAGFKIAYKRSADPTFTASEDISGMTHLVFDLYIDDASKLIDQQRVHFELGSADKADVDEVATNQSLEEIVGKTLKSGWNHVEIPLSAFATSGNEGTTLDRTAWKFFRLYNDGVFPAGVKLGLANMYFMNADCEEHYSHASYSFRVNGKDEGLFRVTDGGISNDNGAAETDTAEGFRFMDQAKVQVYAFGGIDGDRIDHASITTKTAQQLAIWVAKSFNGPWAEVYMYQTTYMNENGDTDPDGSQLKSASRTYDLTAALNTLPGDSDMLYVKIGDSYPGGGWGGKITGAFQLDVRYDESIPEYVENTAEYTFEVLRANEGAYLYEDAAYVSQESSRVNSSRYADGNHYLTYRYPLGNAKNADALYWTAQTRNQLRLLVSTDNKTWVEVYTAGSAQLAPKARAYDLLAALKSAANTATTADYLYVRICDSVTADGYGGGVVAYTNVTLHATVNDNVDVRAYDDDSFLLFTQGEQDHLIYDTSYGQVGANGSYNTTKNSANELSSTVVKDGERRTTANSRTDKTAADNISLGNNLLDETPSGNVNNKNKLTFKFTDNSKYILYRFNVSPHHLSSASRLTYHAYMGNEARIELSVDGGTTWPYVLYNDASSHNNFEVTIDLLSFDGLRDALIEAGGSFQLRISDADTNDGWGAKIIGYEDNVVGTKTSETTEVTVGDAKETVVIYNYDSYPRKPYPVSMTMEYDANTAGKAIGTAFHEFNYVGEPIYKENTGSNKDTYPYLYDMPVDPNEPLYTGNDTAGNKVLNGIMSINQPSDNNTLTQAGGRYDGNWRSRYYDQNYFVYYYSLENLDASGTMTLSLPLGGQYGIKVAVGSSVCPEIVTDSSTTVGKNRWGGSNWVFLTDYVAEGGSGNGPSAAMRTYQIDPAIFGDAIKTATHVYFMFYDCDASNGSGARIALGAYKNGQPINPVTFTYRTATDVKGIAGASLSLTEDFNVTYSVGNVIADAAPVFTFTLGDDAAKVVTAAMEGGRLVAPFENIMPYRLAETISTKMYAKVNGVVHTFEHTYSVKDYCVRMLPKSTSAEMTALLNAILAYGDTAQDYIGYRVDAKPSMGVDGYVAPTATYTPGTYTNHRALTGTPTTATWKSATLLLGSETMIALTFEAADVNGLSVLVDGEAVGFKALGNNLYRVDIPVMPNAFDQPIKAYFAGNDSYVLSYSVGSYFETRYELTGDATRAMLDALYNYGVAASAFAAN